MAMMLKLLGNEVRTAHDGVEAVEVAEAFRPQVILMDVGMPRLNGYEATRRIREQPWGQVRHHHRADRLGPGGRQGAVARGRVRRPPGQAGEPAGPGEAPRRIERRGRSGAVPLQRRPESTWASREKARSGSPIRRDVHEGCALLRVAHVNEPRGTIHRSQGMDRAAGRRLGAAWTTQRASMRDSINLSDLPSPLLRAVRGRQRLPRRVEDDEPRNAPSRFRYVASTSLPWSIRSMSIFPSS